MAKTNGTNGGFNIPSTSLAKTEAPEGSAAWLKSAAKEHGSTDPQKIEKRRERLSAWIATMEIGLKTTKMQKKQFLVRNQKMLDDAKTELESFSKDSASPQQFAEAAKKLDGLTMYRAQQEQQFDMLIEQKIFNIASIDAQCLIVDCLSLRESVKSKSGKTGLLRFSSALYNMDGADFSQRAYRRLRKLYDLTAALNPLVAAQLEKDEVDEDVEESGEAEYADEDVVSEEDRKNIRKEVEGEEEF